MTAKIRTQIGKTWIEIDAASNREAVEKLAEFAEIFSDYKCGCCGKPNIYPIRKRGSTYDFMAFRCKDCTAERTLMNNNSDGSLFFPLKNRDGSPLENGGWSIYKPRPAAQPGSQPATVPEDVHF